MQSHGILCDFHLYFTINNISIHYAYVWSYNIFNWLKVKKWLQYLCCFSTNIPFISLSDLVCLWILNNKTKKNIKKNIVVVSLTLIKRERKKRNSCAMLWIHLKENWLKRKWDILIGSFVHVCDIIFAKLLDNALLCAPFVLIYKICLPSTLIERTLSYVYYTFNPHYTKYAITVHIP